MLTWAICWVAVQLVKAGRDIDADFLLFIAILVDGIVLCFGISQIFS